MIARVGDVVLYRVSKDVVRPAMVSESKADGEILDLHVFVHVGDDSDYADRSVVRRRNVTRSFGPKLVGTWDDRSGS